MYDRLFFVFCLLLLVCLGSAGASVLYVSPTGSDGNVGNQSDPFQTISFAVSVANNGDTILLMAGTFTESSVVNIVGKSIALATASGAQDVIITAPSDVDQSIFLLSSLANVSMTGFTLNGAGGNQSGIMVEESSTLSISSVDFLSCNASGSYGGAIWSDATSVLGVDGCSFTGNSASFLGGAIASFGTLTVSNSNFSSNSILLISSSAGYSLGGAIYTEGSATIAGSTFTLNSATTGGALSNTGTLSVVGSVFIQNSAYFGGGVYSNDTLQLDASLFTGNTATMSGGGLYTSQPQSFSSVNNVAFTNNTASSGGAIAVYGPTVINGSTFLENLAFQCVSCFPFSNYNVGGAIYLSGKVTLSVAYSTFTSNTVRGQFLQGGAIYNSEGQITVYYSTFTRNAADDGGAIFNQVQSVITVLSSTFKSNTATKTGGAIYNAGQMEVDGSAFNGNTAASVGGAIGQAQGSAPVTLNSCTFSNNKAPYGNDIYTEGTPYHPGLSTAEIVGIAIGSAVAAALLVLVGVWLHHRRHNSADYQEF